MALTLTVSIAFVFCLLQPFPLAKSGPGKDETMQRMSTPNSTNSDQSPKKVIFFTYMRSGSSFLGEMSRQNPRHQYWFEPVDGVYSHLYAAVFGWYPLDITQLVNGSRRVFPEYERKSLVRSIIGMLNCKFSQVPLEVVSGPAIFKQNYNQVHTYADCIKKQFVTKKKSKHPLYAKFNQCKRTMRFICPRKFTGTTEDRLVKCYVQGHRKNSTEYHHSNHSKTTGSQSNNWKDFFQKKSESKLKVQMTSYHEELQPTFREEMFQHHKSCLKPFKEASDLCVKHLYRKCESVEARVMKVIRLTMDTVEDLLQVDPTIKIVHLLRDPRAITHSRFGGLISGVAKFMSVSSDMNERHLTEAKLLCSKLRYDIKLRRRLQQKYRNNFLELKYEELAVEPVKMYNRVYQFLGLKSNKVISDWIQANTNSVKIKGKGKFSTARKNSTETAYNWEKGVNYRLVKDINKECKDVLEYLGYEL